MKWILLAFALISLTGCASAPTQEELNAVGYGNPIGKDEAESKVKARVLPGLKDPYSAVISCGDVSTGWVKGNTALGGGLVAGYRISCSINAKNSFGGYVGEKNYLFIFRDGIIAKIMNENADGSLMPSGDF